MVFTLFLWILMLLIFFSSRYNKTNQWCALSIFILSLGTLKEFLYYDLPKFNLKSNGIQFPLTISQTAYSCMTAVTYYLATPCCVIFALYFSKYLIGKTKRRVLITELCLFLPSLLFLFYFPPVKTAFYQKTSMYFWYLVSGYNSLYVMAVTLIMIFSAISEKSPLQMHQKRIICFIVLPPFWYCLITVFFVHCLRIAPLYKIWKDNLIIVCISVLSYIALACTEGIMGLKLQFDHYHWNSDMQISSSGMRYTVHMLKNQIHKIDWCIKNLEESEKFTDTKEIEIISNSVNYIKDFINRGQRYTGDINLVIKNHSISDIIENAITGFETCRKDGIQIDFHAESGILVPSDSVHLTEVFHNFLCNAAEAMKDKGFISIRVTQRPGKGMCLITISDTGCGIPKPDLSKVFSPYFTTKEAGSHYGLGLTYCYNVIRKHHGYLKVKSKEGKGTVFFIYLPVM